MSEWADFLLEVLDIASSVSPSCGAAKDDYGPGTPLSYLTPRETTLHELTLPAGIVLMLISIFGWILYCMSRPENEVLLSVGIVVPSVAIFGGMLWLQRVLLNRGLKRMAEARKAEAGPVKQPE
ncbi:MAG: hypothetical protein WCO60_02655 [Verrucomicrobiota bacterium]